MLNYDRSSKLAADKLPAGEQDGRGFMAAQSQPVQRRGASAAWCVFPRADGQVYAAYIYIDKKLGNAGETADYAIAKRMNGPKGIV